MSDAETPELLPEEQQRVIDFAFKEPEKFRLLTQVVASTRKSKSELRRQPAHLARLLELTQSFLEETAFQPGDAIQWKPGMKNKTRPEYGEPLVVLDVLSEPLLSTTDSSGSPYWRERLDLIAGLLDEDEEFVVFHFDSHRFMPIVPFDFEQEG